MPASRKYRIGKAEPEQERQHANFVVMKKFNLKASGELLTREQMKRIIGGDGYGGGSGNCSEVVSCKCLSGDPDGTCNTTGGSGSTCYGDCRCTSSTAPTSYGLSSTECENR